MTSSAQGTQDAFLTSRRRCLHTQPPRFPVSMRGRYFSALLVFRGLMSTSIAGPGSVLALPWTRARFVI